MMTSMVRSKEQRKEERRKKEETQRQDEEEEINHLQNDPIAVHNMLVRKPATR